MVPGGHIGDIGHAVERVAEAAGFTVVREYVGHAIGRAMHEQPEVPNYGRRGKGPRLQAGQRLRGRAHGQRRRRARPAVLDDGWSVVTADGSWSAHLEHTIAITDDGPEILTLP